MYKQFFSFEASPFSISPDPNFLFLSGRHKEALMHLQHGLKNRDGVLLLTGEVGTGKTLISRCLLQDFPSTTRVANIQNPALSDVELLETLCDEFGISYPNSNISSLFELLKKELIQNYTEKNDAIVVLDEAQHLSLSALEKIIKLTEIEINKQKVLQVILIGQTELQEKLKEKNFRFLAQKITVRYHLLPLTFLETSNYIQHRLGLVGCTSKIFTEKSLNLIYKISNAIPRLINILCNRCLLMAYTNNSQSVTSTVVRKAAQELQLSSQNKEKRHSISNMRLLALVVLLGLSLYEVGSYFGYNISFLNNLTGYGSKDKLVKSEVKTHIPEFDHDHNIDLSAVSFDDALKNLYAVWGYQMNNKDKGCMQDNSTPLSCYKKSFTFDNLVYFNYPGVVKLTIKGKPVYAVLYKINDNKEQLLIKDQLITVSTSWFKGHWNGETTLLWAAPFKLKSDLKFGQQDKKIAWLSKKLSHTKDDKKKYNPNFDLTLLKQVKAFQRSHSLMANGVVGNETLMMLVPLSNPNSPRLMKKDH